MTKVRVRPSVNDPAPAALRALALLLGLFFLFQGLNKLPWLLDSGILAERFQNWSRDAVPSQRWYIETIAMPGVPLFARLVPLAEVSTGLSLVVGFWPRLVAGLALAMVANFHFALGSYFSPEFLIDGAGLPVMGGLLALTIGGARLPYIVRL
jgi:uncharacterized membrane protein YphA (DoxX/SURF4 family)